jgi:hypothetical protein
MVVLVSLTLLGAQAESSDSVAPQPAAGEPASAQSAPAEPASAPAEAASSTSAASRAVEDTASPELVGRLVQDLSITPSQAEAAAGALFGVAKRRLVPEEFAKVEAVVPNIDGLMKATPPKDAKASALALVGSAAGGGGVAGLASTFSALGLKPETIVKLAPTLVKAVEAKGGAEVAALLAGALK